MSHDVSVPDADQLLERWVAAELAGDPDTLEGLLAADFTAVGPRGFVLDKEQWIHRYRTGGLQNEAFVLEELRVRNYGSSVVAVGIQAQQSSYEGHDASGRFRATLIAVQRDGAWTLAGAHLGPLPESTA